MRIFKLKSALWFQENAYPDSDGDWFASREISDRFEEDSEDVGEIMFIPAEYIAQGYMEQTDENIAIDGGGWSPKDIEWAVQCEVFEDSHPELFI